MKPKVLVLAIACAILLFVVVFGTAAYLNLNPDGANLTDGSWHKVVSFRTVARDVGVELYGRLSAGTDRGSFVIVREGVFPFGIKAVSPVYEARHLWRREQLYPSDAADPVAPEEYVCLFNVNIGYGFIGQRDQWRFRMAPSLAMLLQYLPKTGEYMFYGVRYMWCDKIPWFGAILKPDMEREYHEEFRDGRVESELFKVFPTKECR